MPVAIDEATVLESSISIASSIDPSAISAIASQISEIFEMSKHWELENTDFPIEHESYFQNLLPDFESFSAKAL